MFIESRKCVQMDSWASDGFYSHFPSYSQQPSRREALAKARQLEYQTFLDRVTPRQNKSDVKAQKRHTTNESSCKRQKVPTKDNKLPKLVTNTVDEHNESIDMSSRCENKNRFLDELENLDLPDIFNDQMMRERNQKLAEVCRPFSTFSTIQQILFFPIFFLLHGNTNPYRNAG